MHIKGTIYEHRTRLKLKGKIYNKTIWLKLKKKSLYTLP